MWQAVCLKNLTLRQTTECAREKRNVNVLLYTHTRTALCAQQALVQFHFLITF